MDKTAQIAERIAASMMRREAGGGISPSQLYERIRRGLQGMIRDISRKFPETSLRYADRKIMGTVAGHDVEIFYHVMHASNGEVAGLPVIIFDGKQYANIYGNIVDKLEELIGEPVVASSRTAATKDLAALLDLAPEWYSKREQFMVEQEKAQQEFNRKWGEAHAELEKGTDELLEAIRDALVQYFTKSGKGVRSAGSSGGLAEVFVGSRDGVRRYQSKVSAMIQLTFEGQTRTNFTLRNENLDEDVENIKLSPKNTIQKLIQEVKKADEAGFWNLEGIE